MLIAVNRMFETLPPVQKSLFAERLDSAASKMLRQAVLKRDGWKCQNCGTSENLQIHHIRRRSAQGSDVEENLMAVGDSCHRQVQLHSSPRRPNRSPNLSLALPRPRLLRSRCVDSASEHAIPSGGSEPFYFTEVFRLPLHAVREAQ